MTILTFPKAQPRALVVILGHLGVSRQGLERYASYYPDCSVVAAASPPLRFVTHRSLRPTALEIAEQCETVLQQHSVPVLVHAFSNGGAFLLYELDQVWNKPAWACQIFDSCPCYIRMLWDTEHWSESFPHTNWSSIGRTIYTWGASLTLTLWSLPVPCHARSFWNHFRGNISCSHQVYVYTTADMLSDAAAVDRLVTQQRDKGTTVTVLRYDDSDHCRLDRDHPEAYQSMIDEAVQGAIDRAR